MKKMIKKYNNFINESLLNKLEGPSEEEIRKFINHIKDINEKLLQAIKHNFFDIVEDIVRSNNYNEELALRNSLYFDNNKITYYLLKNNKILNSGNINALNLILRQASEFGNLELVIYSIENGADVNSGRSYALRYAIMGGYIDVAKYLIKHGADVELANSFIIKYKKFDDSKILLQLANANESLLNNLKGPTEEEIISDLKNKLGDKYMFRQEYYSKLIKNNMLSELIDLFKVLEYDDDMLCIILKRIIKDENYELLTSVFYKIRIYNISLFNRCCIWLFKEYNIPFKNYTDFYTDKIETIVNNIKNR